MIQRYSLTEIIRKQYFSKLFVLKSEKVEKILNDATEAFTTKNTKNFIGRFLNLFRLLQEETIDRKVDGISRTEIEEGRNIEINFEKIPEDLMLVQLAKQLWRNPVDTENEEIRFLVKIFSKGEEEWEERSASRILIREEDALTEDRLSEMSL